MRTNRATPPVVVALPPPLVEVWEPTIRTSLETRLTKVYDFLNLWYFQR